VKPTDLSLDVILDMLADKIADRLKAAPTSAGPEPKILSIKDAAERSGFSVRSLRHLIRSGSLPQRVLRRFGQRLMIDREEVGRWLRAH
jgi:hypothetical protein